MPEIVNLNRARKARARAAAKTIASENRVRFGRTKAEKSADAHEALTTARTVDDAKLDPR